MGVTYRFQVYAGVNTTSGQGIKQLGNSFWFYFFFLFPMKVDGGHIHSSWGKITTLQAVVSPGRTLRYQGRETTASIRLLL